MGDKETEKNPFVIWMKSHKMTAQQIAIMSDVSASLPYGLLKATQRQIPLGVMKVVDRVDGVGAGEELNQKYQEYRNGLGGEMVEHFARHNEEGR